jgi:hypothetical protein
MKATKSSDMATVLFALVAAFSSICSCRALYLAGVNPQSFAEGDP